ncbi:DUF948 domain-containing protein [Phytohabitans flavus]|uniref:DUF948 domain-containing protein n=1 Tax=Phytohabitans flavus TaxID=1076124 RepID=A0A6F8XKD3_9ACTN|nr:DUF948 domain-containing protein [Phytohabitans flavus]BCB74249.1 hypothetical protein Pflav_006590 [Phytohabitans flavus]
MTGGEIAALVAAGAFLMLVLVLAVPILRLRHTVDAATRAINDINDRTAPLLGNVNTTIEGVNTALGQVHTTLDGVNLQLAKVDNITGHAQSVTANVANLATVVSSAAANPLVKVAAFGYGVRRAAAARRHAEEEREVRTTLKERRKAARTARKAGQAIG